jgi:nicotinamidase-related amidase
MPFDNNDKVALPASSLSEEKHKMLSTDPQDVRTRIFRPQPKIKLSRKDTALLIIDMQYYDAHPDYGVCLQAKQENRIDELDYFVKGLEKIVPNIAELQRAFRAQGMEVIHTRIASFTRDGRDRSLQHKNAGIYVPHDSKEGQILDELAPVGDEMTFTKTVGAVFPSTNLHYVLQNIGIRNLVIVGVVTHGCVEAAVRDASGLNYSVILVEDGCTSFSRTLHENAIRELGVTMATVKCTRDVVEEISKL